MLEVRFTVEETGGVIVLDATGWPTVMHVARNAAVPCIEGECGGDMTCGTCHVRVATIPDGYVSRPGRAELDMLKVVRDPSITSRLACQLPVNDRIGGLRLLVPPV